MSQAEDNHLSSAALVDELILIRQAMREAFLQERWQDLAELDKQCRSVITGIVQANDAQLFELLTDTLCFYRQLVSEFNEQKADISSEVLLLRRAQSRNQVYRQVSVVR